MADDDKTQEHVFTVKEVEFFVTELAAGETIIGDLHKAPDGGLRFKTSDALESKAPTIVYFGGDGFGDQPKDHQGSLTGLVKLIRQENKSGPVRVISASYPNYKDPDQKADHKELIKDRHATPEGTQYSQFGKGFTFELLKDVPNLEGATPAERKAAIEAFSERLKATTFVGYSYGAQVVEDMMTFLPQKLKERGLSDVEVKAALENFKSVTYGDSAIFKKNPEAAERYGKLVRVANIHDINVVKAMMNLGINDPLQRGKLQIAANEWIVFTDVPVGSRATKTFDPTNPEHLAIAAQSHIKILGAEPTLEIIPESTQKFSLDKPEHRVFAETLLQKHTGDTLSTIKLSTLPRENLHQLLQSRGAMVVDNIDLSIPAHKDLVDHLSKTGKLPEAVQKQLVMYDALFLDEKSTRKLQDAIRDVLQNDLKNIGVGQEKPIFAHLLHKETLEQELRKANEERLTIEKKAQELKELQQTQPEKLTAEQQKRVEILQKEARHDQGKLAGITTKIKKISEQLEIVSKDSPQSAGSPEAHEAAIAELAKAQAAQAEARQKFDAKQRAWKAAVDSGTQTPETLKQLSAEALALRRLSSEKKAELAQKTEKLTEFTAPEQKEQAPEEIAARKTIELMGHANVIKLDVKLTGRDAEAGRTLFDMLQKKGVFIHALSGNAEVPTQIGGTSTKHGGHDVLSYLGDAKDPLNIPHPSDTKIVTKAISELAVSGTLSRATETMPEIPTNKLTARLQPPTLTPAAKPLSPQPDVVLSTRPRKPLSEAALRAMLQDVMPAPKTPQSTAPVNGFDIKQMLKEQAEQRKRDPRKVLSEQLFGKDGKKSPQTPEEIRLMREAIEKYGAQTARESTASGPIGIIRLDENRFVVDFDVLPLDREAKAQLSTHLHNIGLKNIDSVTFITPEQVSKLPLSDQVKLWNEIVGIAQSGKTKIEHERAQYETMSEFQVRQLEKIIAASGNALASSPELQAFIKENTQKIADVVTSFEAQLKAWPDMTGSPEEIAVKRAKLAQEILVAQSRALGIDPPELKFKDMGKTTGGEYSKSLATIRLSEALLRQNDPKAFINALSHEHGHHFQAYLADNHHDFPEGSAKALIGQLYESNYTAKVSGASDMLELMMTEHGLNKAKKEGKKPASRLLAILDKHDTKYKVYVSQPLESQASGGANAFGDAAAKQTPEGKPGQLPKSATDALLPPPTIDEEDLILKTEKRPALKDPAAARKPGAEEGLSRAEVEKISEEAVKQAKGQPDEGRAWLEAFRKGIIAHGTPENRAKGDLSKITPESAAKEMSQKPTQDKPPTSAPNGLQTAGKIMLLDSASELLLNWDKLPPEKRAESIASLAGGIGGIIAPSLDIKSSALAKAGKHATDLSRLGKLSHGVFTITTPLMISGGIEEWNKASERESDLVAVKDRVSGTVHSIVGSEAALSGTARLAGVKLGTNMALRAAPVVGEAVLIYDAGMLGSRGLMNVFDAVGIIKLGKDDTTDLWENIDKLQKMRKFNEELKDANYASGRNDKIFVAIEEVPHPKDYKQLLEGMNIMNQQLLAEGKITTMPNYAKLANGMPDPRVNREDFLRIADEKIQKYNDLVKQYNDSTIDWGDKIRKQLQEHEYEARTMSGALTDFKEYEKRFAAFEAMKQNDPQKTAFLTELEGIVPLMENHKSNDGSKHMVANREKIQNFAEKDPTLLPDIKVLLVAENTYVAQAHENAKLQATARDLKGVNQIRSDSYWLDKAKEKIKYNPNIVTPEMQKAQIALIIKRRATEVKELFAKIDKPEEKLSDPALESDRRKKIIEQHFSQNEDKIQTLGLSLKEGITLGDKSEIGRKLFITDWKQLSATLALLKDSDGKDMNINLEKDLGIQNTTALASHGGGRGEYTDPVSRKTYDYSVVPDQYGYVLEDKTGEARFAYYNSTPSVVTGTQPHGQVAWVDMQQKDADGRDITKRLVYRTEGDRTKVLAYYDPAMPETEKTVPEWLKNTRLPPIESDALGLGESRSTVLGMIVSAHDQAKDTPEVKAERTQRTERIAEAEKQKAAAVAEKAERRANNIAKREERLKLYPQIIADIQKKNADIIEVGKNDDGKISVSFTPRNTNFGSVQATPEQEALRKTDSAKYLASLRQDNESGLIREMLSDMDAALKFNTFGEPAILSSGRAVVRKDPKTDAQITEYGTTYKITLDPGNKEQMEAFKKLIPEDKRKEITGEKAAATRKSSEESSLAILALSTSEEELSGGLLALALASTPEGQAAQAALQAQLDSVKRSAVATATTAIPQAPLQIISEQKPLEEASGTMKLALESFRRGEGETSTTGFKPKDKQSGIQIV